MRKMMKSKMKHYRFRYIKLMYESLFSRNVRQRICMIFSLFLLSGVIFNLMFNKSHNFQTTDQVGGAMENFHSEKWVVITSINPPTQDISVLAGMKGWIVLVVADLKTPKDWSHPNCIYLSVEEQEKLKYHTLEHLKYNSYTRKNIGYLYAIQHGARYIYDTDDDNSPQHFDYFTFNHFTNQIFYDTNATVINPYPHFGQSTMWPRVIKLGSSCLPCQVDIRNEENIKAAINTAKEKYGKIDILINNASAIELKDTAHIEPKKYDLIHEINFLGTYAVTKHALPYLLANKNGRVINISPPLNLDKKWFVNHTAYTQSKYSMSLLTLGLSQEYKNKLCSNSLWPKTAIYTAAMEMIAGPDCKPLCRKPSIMADALLEILNQDTKLSGQFYVDEEVLRKRGENCFKKYAYFPDKEGEIMKDFYID